MPSHNHKYLMFSIDWGVVRCKTIIICMPRKYIHIKQLNARTPFTHSQLHFMVRLTEKQSSPIEMEMQNKVVSMRLNEYIQFQYKVGHGDDLSLYVIVIGGCDRVVSIGHLCLNLAEQGDEKKQYLKGVAKQNGYLIYSIRDKPFPQQIRLESDLENQEKIKAKSQILTKSTEIPFKTKDNLENGKKQQRSEHKNKIKNGDSNQSSSQRLTPVSSQRKKGYDSLIDVLNTDKKLIASQKIKSEGHFNSSNKNNNSPHSCLESNGSKYKEVRQQLAAHKQRNNNYSSGLLELQRELIRQQHKIKQLGIVNKY